MDWFKNIPPDAHWVIVGGTRRGKSGLLQLLVRVIIKLGIDGLTAIDPHGAFVRAIIEWLANTNNRHAIGREIHILDPGRSPFGLNCLEVPDTSWESCHLAANTLVSIIESRFEASAEQIPRLVRLLYVVAMFCARRMLTLIEMIEVLSLGGNELRLSLLSEFDNPIVRRELEEVHTLASKHPARFLELVESLKNRLVRLLGHPGMRRILGQRHGLNPRKLMDSRAIVLADFSSFSYSDAAFLGCFLSSMYFSAARYRPPTACARHRLILDEAESLLTVDVARMCDQSAKMGLNLIAAIQRLGQLRARGDFLADAVMTNCTVKVCFGGLEPESARYMTEILQTGFVPLNEWKLGSERPVAVGSEKAIVKNSSKAVHHAQHEATSETESVAYGTARSHMTSVTEADSVSTTDATSNATALSDMSSESFGSGTSSFDGVSSGQSMDPNNLTLFGPPVIGLTSGVSSGTGTMQSHASSSGKSTSKASGTSHAVSNAHTSAVTESDGITESEVHGFAVSRSRGESRGTSNTSGEGETFITKFEWLPSTMYSLEEQLHRLTGELMNLPRRHCIVKIEDQRPFRTRTADLTPAFRSPFFKRLMLPVFIDATMERSPFTLTNAEADRAIASRAHELKPAIQPEPDFAAAEPISLVDDPIGYAKRFFRDNPQLHNDLAANQTIARRGDNDNE